MVVSNSLLYEETIYDRYGIDKMKLFYILEVLNLTLDFCVNIFYPNNNKIIGVVCFLGFKWI